LSAPLLVVMPARNEAANLLAVVTELRSVWAEAEVVVVDDASDDGTADVARRIGCRTLVLPFRLGYGGALQAGVKRREELEAKVEGLRVLQDRRRQRLDQAKTTREVAALTSELELARTVLMREEAEWFRSLEASTALEERVAAADARLAEAGAGQGGAREMLAAIGEVHSAFNAVEILKAKGYQTCFMDLSGFDDDERPPALKRRNAGRSPTPISWLPIVDHTGACFSRAVYTSNTAPWYWASVPRS